MEHSEHNWSQQLEQLSALLDNALSEAERADLEAHLRICADCRAELASLQRTRALLGALPQPSLPRSFTLPLATPTAPERLPQPLPTAQPAPAPARRPAATPPARVMNRRPGRALQWLSTIAAVLGIVFLLASAFSTLSSPHEASSGAAFSNVAAPRSGSAGQATASTTPGLSQPTNTHPGARVTPAPTEQPGAATATPTGTQAGSVGEQPTPGQAAGVSSGPLISTTGLGVLLLILSACGFAIVWALRRRW